MKKFIIKGQEATMSVTLGSLVVAEELNKNIDPKTNPIRHTLNNIVSSFYALDPNCTLTIDDILAYVGSNAKRYTELLKAYQAELEAFNKQPEGEGNAEAAK